MSVITKLTKIEEQSTKKVTMAFEDEDDASVVPDSITWSLYNEHGKIINLREDVNIVTPAASVDIAVYGNDLIYAEGTKRRLVVKATYDSDLGSDLPLTGIAEWDLVKLA